VVLDVVGSNPIAHPEEIAGQSVLLRSLSCFLSAGCPILGAKWEWIMERGPLSQEATWLS
jgi:hypothetical protein